MRRLGILLFVIACLGQGSAKTTLGNEVSVDTSEIEARIESLSAVPESDEDSRMAVADLQEALRFRKTSRAAEEKIEEFQKKSESAPADLEVAGNQTADVSPVTIAEGASLETLEQKVDLANESLAEAQALQKRLEKEKTDRIERKATLPGLIVEAELELDNMEIPEAPFATDSARKSAAHLRAIEQMKLLRKQLELFQVERDYLQETTSLFATDAAIQARRVEVLAKNADVLQKRLAEKRASASVDELARAKEDVKKFPKDSEESVIAREVLRLAEIHGGETGLRTEMKELNAMTSRLDNRLARVEKQFSNARRRVKLLEEVGLSIDPATGKLLRSQREGLLTDVDYKGDLRDLIEASAQAQIELLVLEDRYADYLTKSPPNAEENPELARLWTARMSGLERLVEDYRNYIKALQKNYTNLRSLSEISTEFALFVDERLLWIPSTAAIKLDEPLVEWRAISRLVDRKPFLTLWEDVERHFILWGVVISAVVTLVLFRRKFRKRLRKEGAAAAKRNCTSFYPTFLSVVYSILLTAPIPLFLWFVCSRSFEGSEAVTNGLKSVSGFLSVSIFIRVLTQSDGLLIDHFRMKKERVLVLRRALDWLIPTMPLFLFLATSLPLDPITSADGRLSFIAVVTILLLFYEQLLRPSKQLIHWHGTPSKAVAVIFYGLALVISFALIIGAVIGYYASVQEVRLQVLMSLGTIAATLFVSALLYRWILVSRRRFAVDEALKRRAASIAEREGRETPTEDKPQNVASLDEVKASAVKVVQVEEQTNRLVRAAAIAFIVFGLIGIWRSAVPALSALDRVSIWEQAEEKSDSSENSLSSLKNPIAAITGKNSSSESEDIQNEENSQSENKGNSPVTLQDVFISFVILFLTFVGARNIPGLLELAVFRHLNLPLGSSFAFTTTIRYSLVVTGVVAAFAMIGINWGNVQWIAAAITLGIGFGLQEIFANFVAGLIILFERPIRLGDIVTIAGVDGKVTQIRIRATTIRQFNNRELVVPNKEFITGQLINWTLSDSILRTDIRVGIAYGSDTELARELLIQSAKENERILEEPEPVVLFDEFGDSALTFILRTHVSGVEDLLPAKSELHFAVDQAFKKAGIEISFPQQDIHIKSMPEPKKPEITEGNEETSSPGELDAER